MLISAGVVLLLFIVITALILDQAFKRSLQTDLQDRLQTQLYLVLGAAEFEHEQLYLPQALNFPKLNQLGSGSIALIVNEQGQEVWRSGSALGYAENFVNQSLSSGLLQQAPGQQGQGKIEIAGQPFFLYEFRGCLGIARRCFWEGFIEALYLAHCRTFCSLRQEHQPVSNVFMVWFRVVSVDFIDALHLDSELGFIPFKAVGR
jgi:plasmid maintenance system killer protein